jgi:hypothetical protein
MSPTLIRLRSDGRRNGDARVMPASYDVTGLSLPNAFHAVHRIPVDAEYVIRVFLGGLRPANSDPISLSLWVDDKQIATMVHDPERAATFADDRQDFGGQTTEFRVRLTAGDRVLIGRACSIRRRLRRRNGSRRCANGSKRRRRNWRRSR